MISSLPILNRIPAPPAQQVQRAALGMVKLAGFSPKFLRFQSVQAVLNRVFAEAIEDGDLDFLEDRTLIMKIEDANFSLAITAVHLNGKLVIRCLDTELGEATIRGNLAAFVHLGAKTMDPDMLFFQRKLVTEGDTALGLEFKNLTDAFELDKLPKPLQEALTWLAGQHQL